MLFFLDYDSDGTWLGAHLNTEPEPLAAALYVRDTALRESMPWTNYLTGHPELIRRLPKGN